MPQKNAPHPQKNTHDDKQIQQKPGDNSTKISGLHCIFLDHPPLENFGVNTSDLYNILDMREEVGGYCKFLFINEINKNDSTFCKICTLSPKNT